MILFAKNATALERTVIITAAVFRINTQFSDYYTSRNTMPKMGKFHYLFACAILCNVRAESIVICVF